MNDIFDKVVYFNQKVVGIEQRSPQIMPNEEVQYTKKALYEEIQEFLDEYQLCLSDDNTIKPGYDLKYLVGMADALMDNIYFAIGALYKLGLTPSQMRRCMYVIHECNMKKKLGRMAKRDTGAADAVKPEDWKGPEELIAEILQERIE